MKKIIAFAILSVFLFWFFTSDTSISPTGFPDNTPTSTPAPSSLSVQIDGDLINYSFFQTTPNRISLIPNFIEKKSSGQLLEENNCAAGINGGFYNTNNQPLGLFVTNFQTVGNNKESLLFNGYIGIGANNTVYIGHELLDMHNRITLQTGPLLIVNGQPLPLKIKNDEHARRMVAAITANGALVFLTLFDENATFNGPLLGDVPNILSAINTKELFNITDAINLDGGSASAFYTNTVSLAELTSVGSFFCQKIQ